MIYEVYTSTDSCTEYWGWVEVPLNVFLTFSKDDRRIIQIIEDNHPDPEKPKQFLPLNED